jgi:hypothetical protein
MDVLRKFKTLMRREPDKFIFSWLNQFFGIGGYLSLDDSYWVRGVEGYVIDDYRVRKDKKILHFFTLSMAISVLFLIAFMFIYFSYYLFSIGVTVGLFLILFAFSHGYVTILILSYILIWLLSIYAFIQPIIHESLWVWLELIRGERGSRAAKSNFISESIKILFVDKNGLFKHATFARFDTYLMRLQLNYLDAYKNGIYFKIIMLGTAWVSFKNLFSLLQSSLALAKKISYCILTLFTMLVCGMIKPFDIFAVVYWIMVFMSITLNMGYRNTVRIIMILNNVLRSYVTIKADGTPVDFRDDEGRKYIVFRVGNTLSITHFISLYLKMTRLRLSIWVISFLYKIGFIIDRKSSEENIFGFRSVFTSFSLEITRKINEINVPAWIRSIAKRDPTTVEETLKIMTELGYPSVEMKTQAPQNDILKGTFNDWIETGSNFITGLHRLKTYDFVEFNKFRKDVIEFRRTDSYVTIENELESISRYFKNKNVEIPLQEKIVDELWTIVKEIFRDSRITPLRPIYKKWKKNYNVGPFAPATRRKKDGSFRKMKRSEDIARFPNLTSYMKYWQSLYAHFPQMRMISTAFYKSESLPPKKWMKDKVRTPIGSMLPQYLWQMVWSYEPNHRFKPIETPIKIGLPLTGFHLSSLFMKHQQYDLHYAGDCSDFDSTITQNIQEIVKAIRKRGFERHRQSSIIAEMIDINYERLNASLLVTPTTGNVYKKGTGLTTGHASTSADNSLTTVALYLAAWIHLTGLSAHEFTFFNELSCYGDDHLLSIKRTAPRVWTFDNVRAILKTWGVTMNNEMPNSDPRFLEPLPFLSKFCRKSTSLDDEIFKRVLGHPAPELVVYHDSDKLIGKMMAPVLTRDPKYKITRILSYMDLCAHNEKAYYIAREVIEEIISKNTDLAYLRCRIPSYDEVIKKFYSPDTSVREPEERDVEDFDPEDLIEYGQLNWMDYFMNYISIIPDVLNPNIKNAGFGKSAQQALGPLVDWPKELIMRSNRVYSPGHLMSLLGSCSYDFIDNVKMVSFTTPILTLLIRHWLFLFFRKDSEKYNPFAWIDYILQKMSSLQFIMNGKVQTRYKNYSFPVWNLMLISILNLIYIPDIILDAGEGFTVDVGETFLSLRLPDLSYWLGLCYTMAINLIWDNVPPNFKNLSFIERVEAHGKAHLIIAGTGTGKSTTMILYLQQSLGAMFKRIIVVEPRSKVVKGLTKYCRSIGVQCSGLTTGLTLDRREKVWYMTAQELLLHPHWIGQENLFVIDESHLDELAYDVTKKLLLQTPGLTILMATATPSQENRDMCATVSEIELAQIYKIKMIKYNDDKVIAVTKQNWLFRYIGIVTEIMATYKTPEKFLIFVNDKSDLELFRRTLSGKGIFLSSDTDDTDMSQEADFIVTTAVCDVAITIPGVTVVITPNFTRTIHYDEKGSSNPIFTYLSGQTLTQRKGRTGRTNNGDFYLLNFRSDDISLSNVKTDEGQIVEWLSSGLDMALLGLTKPELFKCFGDITNQKEVDQIVKFIEFSRQDDSKIKTREEYEDLKMSREANSVGIRAFGRTGASTGFRFKIIDVSKGYEILIERCKSFVQEAEDWINMPIPSKRLRTWKDLKEFLRKQEENADSSLA